MNGRVQFAKEHINRLFQSAQAIYMDLGLTKGELLSLLHRTLDANDMRFATAQGFNTAEQFYTYLKDSFDVLYAEGETAPKMMSVGMHCRLLGRPGRFRALQRFLDYIQQHDKVWVCTRQQIADHWRETHPYRG